MKFGMTKKSTRTEKDVSISMVEFQSQTTPVSTHVFPPHEDIQTMLVGRTNPRIVIGTNNIRDYDIIIKSFRDRADPSWMIDIYFGNQRIYRSTPGCHVLIEQQNNFFPSKSKTNSLFQSMLRTVADMYVYLPFMEGEGVFYTPQEFCQSLHQQFKNVPKKSILALAVTEKGLKTMSQRFTTNTGAIYNLNSWAREEPLLRSIMMADCHDSVHNLGWLMHRIFGKKTLLEVTPIRVEIPFGLTGKYSNIISATIIGKVDGWRESTSKGSIVFEVSCMTTITICVISLNKLSNVMVDGVNLNCEAPQMFKHFDLHLNTVNSNIMNGPNPFVIGAAYKHACNIDVEGALTGERKLEEVQKLVANVQSPLQVTSYFRKHQSKRLRRNIPVVEKQLRDTTDAAFTRTHSIAFEQQKSTTPLLKMNRYSSVAPF